MKRSLLFCLLALNGFQLYSQNYFTKEDVFNTFKSFYREEIKEDGISEEALNELFNERFNEFSFEVDFMIDVYSDFVKSLELNWLSLADKKLLVVALMKHDRVNRNNSFLKAQGDEFKMILAKSLLEALYQKEHVVIVESDSEIDNPESYGHHATDYLVPKICFQFIENKFK